MERAQFAPFYFLRGVILVTEPVIHTKRKAQQITCPVCGHTWTSRGKGKYYRCPACFEKETGKKIGSFFRETKGYTMRIIPERAGQSDPDPVPGPVADPAPAPAADPVPFADPAPDQGGSWLKKLMNTPLTEI